jgi:hypothetical protein
LLVRGPCVIETYAGWQVSRRIFIGGGFQTVGGLERTHLAVVDARTGAVADWSPQPSSGVDVIRLAGGRLYVTGLVALTAGPILACTMSSRSSILKGFSSGVQL